MNDTLMIHSISASTKNNAAKFSHNSIQGHHHSLFEIAYARDTNMIRWSMTVGCLMDTNSVAAKYGEGVVLKRPIIGCGVIVSEAGNTLVISDLHIPYHHCDSFDFLETVAYDYDCETILNVGDILDNHSGSYHESEPEALSAEEEYEKGKQYIQELNEMFPVMTITEGNHDRIPKRKLKTAGLPSSMLDDYNKLYELENKWKWTDKHFFNSHGGQPILIPMVLNKKGRWDRKIQGAKT